MTRILAGTFPAASHSRDGRCRAHCVALAICFVWGSSATQAYPDKPVTMIAPFPAGGSVDLVARAVAQQMSDAWKQPVVVVNRPGAGGNIGADAVVRAAPDGYTLLMGTTALASSSALYAKLSYDVTRDLAPVSLVVTMSNVLVVHPSLPARSVRELIALARGRPGLLNSASAGVGSSNHLALVLFNTMTAVDIGHIPYKGAAPAVAEVMGGHVAMTFVPIAAAVPPVKAGRLRALGVTGTARSAALPLVPTVAESGVPGYQATSWNALLAPASTPGEVVARIHAALAGSLRAPRVSEILASAGAEPAGSSPDAFARFLREEIAKWGAVIKAAGLKPE